MFLLRVQCALTVASLSSVRSGRWGWTRVSTYQVVVMRQKLFPKSTLKFRHIEIAITICGTLAMH